MDVILRVKPSEIKVNDLYFPKGDLNKRPWRVDAIIRSKACEHWPQYDATTFSVSNDIGDDHTTLYEIRRYVVSREVVFVDGSFR